MPCGSIRLAFLRRSSTDMTLEHEEVAIVYVWLRLILLREAFNPAAHSQSTCRHSISRQIGVSIGAKPHVAAHRRIASIAGLASIAASLPIAESLNPQVKVQSKSGSLGLPL